VNFGLGLAEGGAGGKGFSYRIAMDSAGETKLRVVAGIVGLGESQVGRIDGRRRKSSLGENR
jgi:hypothetical protein